MQDEPPVVDLLALREQLSELEVHLGTVLNYSDDIESRLLTSNRKGGSTRAPSNLTSALQAAQKSAHDANDALRFLHQKASLVTIAADVGMMKHRLEHVLDDEKVPADWWHTGWLAVAALLYGLYAMWLLLLLDYGSISTIVVVRDVLLGSVSTVSSLFAVMIIFYKWRNSYGTHWGKNRFGIVVAIVIMSAFFLIPPGGALWHKLK
jgi:hypothetical protein